MAKRIKVLCPHCSQEHWVSLPYTKRMKRMSLRQNKIGSRFEWSAVVDPDVLELGEWSRRDDLALYPLGAVAGAVVCLCGFMIARAGAEMAFGPLPPTDDLLPVAASGGAALGTALTHWWLCDEARVRRRAFGWLKNLQGNWHLTDAGEEKQKPVVLEVDHRYRDGYTEAGRTINYFGALPVDVDRFNDYVRAILAGETLAINQWTGSGKPFSRQEYEKLLDILRQAGAAVNVPGKGHQLTGGGQRAMKQHLKRVEVVYG